jgi:hypothetical protein
MGSNTRLYQGAYNPAATAYQYAFNSIPVLNLVETPSNSNLANFAMLNDRMQPPGVYRFYFQTL